MDGETFSKTEMEKTWCCRAASSWGKMHMAPTARPPTESKRLSA